MNTPAADIEVGIELAATLVRQQHPDLAGPLALIAEGWDNVLFRLGDQFCLRLPRRRVAAEWLLSEQRWLPSVAGRVSVPVPAPVRVGVPSDLYPWPWTICRWIEGTAASDLPAAERGEVASQLALFMNELHVPAPPEAPRSQVRGVPIAARDGAVRERLAEDTIPRSGELLELWDRLARAPEWAGPPFWVHGDPHPANILIGHRPGADASATATASVTATATVTATGVPDADSTRRGQNGTAGAFLAGVIDFGDLNGGDPATDLAAAWMVFDASARATFRDHLGQVDEHTWQRARAWALNLSTALAAFSADNPRMAAIADFGIEQVLLGE